jgi:hypothetical protein
MSAFGTKRHHKAARAGRQHGTLTNEQLRSPNLPRTLSQLNALIGSTMPAKSRSPFSLNFIGNATKMAQQQNGDKPRRPFHRC